MLDYEQLNLAAHGVVDYHSNSRGFSSTYSQALAIDLACLGRTTFDLLVHYLQDVRLDYYLHLTSIYYLVRCT